MSQSNQLVPLRMLSVFNRPAVRVSAGMLAVLVISTLFQQGQGPNAPAGNVDLQLSITPQEDGVYAIAGSAKLPEETQLAIAAVRYLSPAGPQPGTAEPVPTYSILAYQVAAVKQGQWQTQLNLWQVAPDGRYREAWQLEQQRLGLQVEPSSDVIFLATLNPISKIEPLPLLEQQLRAQKLRLSGQFVYTTPEGQQYVQVQQQQAVALPSGQTRPPGQRPEDLNDGWGERYLMPGEPPNPYRLERPQERQTNAPMRREEFLR